jgi:mRNA interferase RelE/StbE
MIYSIEFIQAAYREYSKLDGSVKKIVDKKLGELSKNPFLGKPLGKKYNIDLTGFFKLYAAKKQYRIVYRLLSPTEVEIIEIWGIGKRDKEAIYRLIHQRFGEKDR